MWFIFFFPFANVKSSCLEQPFVMTIAFVSICANIFYPIDGFCCETTNIILTIGMFVFAIRIMIARVSCCLHFCFFFNEKYFFCMDQKWPNRDPLVWMDKVFNSIEKIESKIPGFWIPGFSKKSCRYIGASIIPQAWFKEKSIMWWFLNKMKSYKL